MNELHLYLRALLSEIAWTIAWFWSSSIFLPIVHQYLSYQNALTLVAIYHIFWNISRFSYFRKYWDRWVFLKFWIPSIFLTVVWALLAWSINPSILKMFLWIILSLFAMYSLFRSSFKLPLTKFTWILWGWLSWFTAWLIWTWGVLRWAFMNSFWLSKESYISTIASIALLVDFTRIPVYFWQGFLDKQYLKLIPILFVVAFIWSYVWKKIIKLIPTKLLRQLIMLAIIAWSMLLFYQWYTTYIMGN